jgi:hypothetical protein
MAITFCSLCIAAAAIVFAVRSWSDERNARLVEIGVSILRVEPEKDSEVRAAREWAINLIDANAGGVKFSAAARAELLQNRLDVRGGFTDGWWDSGSYDLIKKPPKSSK